MKNYLGSGDVVQMTAPSGGVISGTPVVILSAFVIPQATVAETLPFAGLVEGLVNLPKGSTVVFSEGEAVFWDDATKLCKESATGYFKIGYATKAAGNPSSFVDVKLAGIPVVAV